MEGSVCETSLQVRNSQGLHMRPAMLFVDMASQFACDIRVTSGDTEVDGKSIMQMTMLAAVRGTSLTVRAEGVDADKAIEALRDLVEVRRFDE